MNNSKVSTRLAIGFGSVMFLLITVALVGFYGISSLHSRLDSIARVNNDESKYAKDMKASVADRAIAIRNIALLTDPAGLAQESKRVERQKKVYANAEEALGKMFATEAGTTDRERSLYTQIKEDNAVAVPLMDKAIGLGLANNPSEAIKVLLQEARPKQAAWLSHLNELADFEDQLNAQATEEANVTYHVIQITAWVIVGFSLILGVFLAILITRSILKQLGGEPAQAQKMAQQIAQGNLTQKVHVAADDNASLMASLEAMRTNLSNIVSGIKTSAESISVAAGEISQGNVDLSQRTEEQAASLEETAASMEEITATVRQNTENARQGSTLANTASETAATGGEVVGRVVTTMQDIATSSSKVAEIITVIEGIAFQTNILALNAAVEAARAGEQGRGFAVVAGEVRTLAQRSAAAAKEITELIGTSVAHVNAGEALVHNAGQTMSEVVRSVKRVTDIMGEIASASSEQTIGIEQVNVAVSQMDEVTQQNAALVEQATAAARAMADQAQALRDSVAIFRISADANASSIGHQSSIERESISHNYRHTSRQGKAFRRAA
ncbi:chemotaxis protein [Robbsia andropogonis]|uniref:Chemotaxis protein n=1 Tax=Robbsia andropogonis TaxID=28092 RepID=A0A0F5JW91_9BURK|nr:methyl-accepting chemotaxis protein [Robbsia andropogonis]KKB61980.1 chemotaxis protein [Robbsia andropogonis]